ncbi:MAG: thioredoxin domain-containing protein [Gemmatimonadales bacterium]|nr:thioredoxin domain-containing protein [Gemmatimonadales bacterium]MDZ4388385.1 thioredoxin domain-containing protein [Gemmatimonadales bacterium]
MASTASLETRWLLRMAVGCAGVMTLLAVARFFGFRLDPPSPRSGPPRAVAVEHWDEVVGGGHRLGPAEAPVVIVEFVDFECPYCRGYAMETLPAIQASYPTEVTVVARHFPLRYHRFAEMSAVAAICADRQGRFRAMYDLLYGVQDSLGLLPWRVLAERSGVPDLDSWEECRDDPGVRAVMEADQELGKRIGATGTPTILVNGWRYERPLQESELRTVIDSILGR